VRAARATGVRFQRRPKATRADPPRAAARLRVRRGVIEGHARERRLDLAAVRVQRALCCPARRARRLERERRHGLPPRRAELGQLGATLGSAAGGRPPRHHTGAWDGEGSDVLWSRASAFRLRKVGTPDADSIHPAQCACRRGSGRGGAAGRSSAGQLPACRATLRDEPRAGAPAAIGHVPQRPPGVSERERPFRSGRVGTSPNSS